MKLRSTHTYCILEVSESTFKEITEKLRAADYGHAFDNDGKTIDMYGIALEQEKVAECPATPKPSSSTNRSQPADSAARESVD